MKGWALSAMVGLGLVSSPTMARDLYLTSATQNERAYLDVQSIQEKANGAAVVRVFEAEVYRIQPVANAPSVFGWVIAANCSTPFQTSTVEQVVYSAQGKEEQRLRFQPAGTAYVFEDNTETSLFGDFWLAACKGEGIQAKGFRMFARTPAEVLEHLRRPPVKPQTSAAGKK